MKTPEQSLEQQIKARELRMQDSSASRPVADTQNESALADYDDLSDLFYEVMANYFPSSWNTFYGDACEDNEQWHLWRRFLQRYQITPKDLEQICDQLVEEGERFAPNQGVIKRCLDKVRSSNQANIEIYRQALRDLYNINLRRLETVKNPAAIEAIKASGGYGWHLEMQTAQKELDAFKLWEDHYQHAKAETSTAYQNKLENRKNAPKPQPSQTDIAMLKLALKKQDLTPELRAFADKLGIDDSLLEQLAAEEKKSP